MPMLALLILFWLNFATAKPSLLAPTIEQWQVGEPDKEPVSVSGLFPNTFMDPTCSEEQKSKITSAWNGAKKLIEAQTSFDSSHDSVPHKTFFGFDWNVKGDTEAEYRTTKIVENNERAGKLFKGEVPDNEQFNFYCKDIEDNCDESETAAISWYKKKAGNQGFIQTTVFCPDFFDEVDNLEELIEQYKDKPDEQVKLELFEMTDAITFLHETYHYRVVHLNKPAILDYDSKAGDYDTGSSEDNWYLARDKGTIETSVNADSYVFVALVIYLQQTFKTSNIALPEDMRGKNPSERESLGVSWLGRR
ncbi:Metalloproteases (zincins), catalytic [Glarea lozoyensis ATCC 20868]|uniref:Metalloproteases (Zincins), catalytic n=1 Tax=Glarea lozoyensis (strain ATCC 20868 / MF5171) TaxID=1116229 RepID=S3EB93_GLAL2|nr:Metalloproteases (zincins), catalytic [Glarea lozoyensis ATCC 20868]EPE35588.1 Metalloproteases (zincins), catalytic [Glarea lozoyensis ATCC 20868]